MPESASNLEKARGYLKIVESGDFDDLTQFFAPGALIEQLPNRIYPNGARAKALQTREAFEKGRKLFSSQKYEIIREVVNGDTLL